MATLVQTTHGEVELSIGDSPHADLAHGAIAPFHDAAGATMDCAHAPLRALEALPDGRWLAMDNDPQFHLLLPAALPGGHYRITARLHGCSVSTPCVYLDLGDGWGESSRFDLTPSPGSAEWTVVLALPGMGASLRFDPSDRAGEFAFAGATVQALSTAAALIELLAKQSRQAPHMLPAVIEHASRIARTEGTGAAVAALVRGDMASHVHAASTYAQWAARHETLTPTQRDALRAAVAKRASRPLLSLLLPVTDGDVAVLDGFAASLQAQIYPDWELCLLPDRDAADATATACARLAEHSSRIRVVQTGTDDGAGGHPLLASGVNGVEGSMCALADAHLRLPGHALLMVADAISRRPDAQLVYSDEDVIDLRGERSDPYFKPQWDPLLALTPGYPGPLAFYDVVLVRAACDAADGQLSAQALALRCTALVDADRAIHLPHVLAHALQVDGSGEARASDVFPALLAEHLEATEPTARLSLSGRAPRVSRTLPIRPPKVSIVIPTRDRVDLLRRCVDSILEQSTYSNFEILIVDNQSSDPETLAYFDAASCDVRVRVIAYDLPFNYSAVNNFAVERVDGEVIALLNNDVEVITDNWIEEMLQYALLPDVGAVGAMLYYPDDTIQHAGVVLGLGGVAGHAYTHQPRGFAGQRGRARQVQRMGAVTAACLLVRREAYLRVGGLDESLAIAFNDVDFCLRLAQAGLSNVWTPFAELYHHESASRGTEDTPEKQARFASEVHAMLVRWSPQLMTDAAYHPNLSLAFDSAFALADLPRAPLALWVDGVTGRREPPGVHM